MALSSTAGDGPVRLSKLRSDPKAVINDYAFVVAGSAAYDGRTDGGPCTISCAPIGNNIYRLTPSQGSGPDFYFPYVSENLNGGVGQCRVPADAPDGTIVLTSAMNGCSLDIRRSGADLVFRHIANGMPVPDLPLKDPQLRCRIDARLYMIPRWEQNVAASIGSRSTPGKSVGAMPMHYLISVKQARGWVVLNSGLLQVTSASGGQVATVYERLLGMNTVAPIASSF